MSLDIAHPAARCTPPAILPPGSPLRRNLAALWAVQPGLAETLEHATPTPRPGGSGAGEVDPAEAFAVIAHGIGDGHAVARLLKATADETRVLCVEPDAGVLRHAIETTDLADALDAGRLTFTRGGADDVDAWLEARPDAVGFGTRRLVIDAADEALHAAVAARCDENVAARQIAVNTAVEIGRRSAEHALANLPRLLAGPTVGPLKGALAGRTAVLVSAGPSLRKNARLLAGLRDKAVLLCVQTALKPLAEMGIVPHAAVSLDSHPMCARFFRDLPESARGVRLVADPRVSPGLLTAAEDAGLDVALTGLRWLDRVAGRPLAPTLDAGGTVALMAVRLAELLGCARLVLVGQDLSFPDGLYYVPGTGHEQIWRGEFGRFRTAEMLHHERIMRDAPIHRRLPAVGGGEVLSEARLADYLREFEAAFAATPMQVFDATEGGALKQHTTPTTLAAVAEQLAAEPHGPVSLATPPAAPADAAPLRRRLDEAAVVARVARRTSEVLDAATPATLAKRMPELDALRRELRPVDEAYGLVTLLMQAGERDRRLADLAAAVPGLSDHERQRRQLARDRVHAANVADAAATFADTLGRAVATLPDDQRRAA